MMNQAVTPHGSFRCFLVDSDSSSERYCVDLLDKGDGNKRGTCDCWHFLNKCEPRNRRDGLGRTCKHVRKARKYLSKLISQGHFKGFLELTHKHRTQNDDEK